MKLLSGLSALFIFFYCITACSKHDTAPGIPPVLDTLLGWQKTTPSKTTIADIAFLTPAKGFYIVDSSLYSSSDSGKTWTLVPGVRDPMLNLFLLNAQRGVVQGVHSIFITSDYIHWSAKQSPAIDASTINFPGIQFTSGATGFSFINNNLYKTTDSANTWNSVFTGYVEGMFFFNDNEGFIYTINTPSPPSNLFHTSDGGAHWQPLSSLPGNPFSYNIMQFTDRMHGWFMRSDTLYGTVDGGSTWLAKGFPASILLDVQFINNQTGYLARGAEILKTTDGGQTWVRSCKIGNGVIYDIFFLDEKTGWAGCTDGSILRLKQ